MFSRGVAVTPTPSLSRDLLPARGSDHAAFVEMLFLWGSPHGTDDRFRSVVLPSGFSLQAVDESRWHIVDRNGFTRAIATAPKDRGAVPSIQPVKRFTHGADRVSDGYRGFVKDWNSVVYRATISQTQDGALRMAKKWLDANKPRWDSYTSPVNFERTPA